MGTLEETEVPAINSETKELAGQVAVVTGGSGAIGGAIVDVLEKAGARAISLDLTEATNGRAWVKCDVREESSIQTTLEAISDKEGRVGIAVHAAGISRDAVVWKTSVSDWDSVQAVNLRGAFLLLRHSIPLMRRAQRGRIVLVGSINGSRGKFGTSAYSASKAGLLGLAKSVAREVGRFGICVNVVEPGWVHTPLTETVPQEVKDQALAESLLQSFVEPADVAACVRFLCGPGARHITGQILRVDSGQFLGGA